MKNEPFTYFGSTGSNDPAATAQRKEAPATRCPGQTWQPVPTHDRYLASVRMARSSADQYRMQLERDLAHQRTLVTTLENAIIEAESQIRQYDHFLKGDTDEKATNTATIANRIIRDSSGSSD